MPCCSLCRFCGSCVVGGAEGVGEENGEVGRGAVVGDSPGGAEGKVGGGEGDVWGCLLSVYVEGFACWNVRVV